MKYLIKFSILFLPGFVFCQGLPNWGISSKAARIPYYVSSLPKDSFVVVKNLGEVALYSALKQSPHLLFPSFDQKPKNASFFNEGVFRMANHLFLFTSIDNSSTETRTLFVHRLDEAENSMITGKELFTLSYRKSSGDMVEFLVDVLFWNDPCSRKGMNGFDFQLSPNGEFLCVIYYSAEDYGYKVFDKDLNVVHSGSLEEYNSASNYLVDWKVSNAGELFLLVSNEHNPGLNACFYLFKLKTDLVKTSLPLKGKGVTNLSVTPDNYGRALISGIKMSAHRKRSLGYAAGFFCLLASPDKGEVIAENTSLFNREFILEGYSEKEKGRFEKLWKKKGIDPGIRNLKMLKFEPLESGGYLALAEQVTVYEENIGEGAQDEDNPLRSYLYEHLVLMRLDEQGKMLWSRKVQKSQVCKSNQPISFASAAFMLNGEDCYLFFNDHPVNYNSETGEFSPKKRVVSVIPKGLNVIACVKFNLKTGGNERFVLDQTIEHFMLIPKCCLPDPLQNKLLLYTWNTKLERWGSLNFR